MVNGEAPDRGPAAEPVDAYASAPADYGPAPVSYAPQAYGYQNQAVAGYYQPQRQSGPIGLCVAAMVLGICAIVFDFTSGLGIFPGIAAVITGHLGYTRQPRGKNYAVAGLIMGYAGIVLSVLAIALVVVFVVFLSQHPETFGNVKN